MLPRGEYEHNFTQDEKRRINIFLRSHPGIGGRQVEAAIQADHQLDYFTRLSYVAGTAVLGLSFFLPVVRQQPFVKRCFLAAIPGGITYRWTQGHGEQIWWDRTFTAYKKFITSNNGYDTQPNN